MRDERGVSALEMVIFVPFLILIVLIMVQLGVMVIRQVELDAAAREGGRAGAVVMSVSACQSSGTEILQAMNTQGQVSCSEDGGYMRAQATSTVPVIVPFLTQGGLRGGQLQMQSVSNFRLEGKPQGGGAVR